ncbi:MAG: DUF1156 domain-containing protein [Saprospirales bacterium]|nr:DUF1156 domain-containing protein [Saprospirales bacterium]
MPTPKKLIESALPVKEISAESVRDKSIRHGHISTLHLWWARRPLPVCRAVVFASLVPDPLDSHCPPAFRDAVELLLGKAHNPGDPYRPYADIPWTAIYDPMEDNLRNRLQMFIGRFSAEAEQAMLLKKPTPPAGKMLSDFSLIKWDNKNNEEILNKARKLIWVAHNGSTPSPAAAPSRSKPPGSAAAPSATTSTPWHISFRKPASNSRSALANPSPTPKPNSSPATARQPGMPSPTKTKPTTRATPPLSASLTASPSTWSFTPANCCAAPKRKSGTTIPPPLGRPGGGRK